MSEQATLPNEARNEVLDPEKREIATKATELALRQRKLMESKSLETESISTDVTDIVAGTRLDRRHGDNARILVNIADRKMKMEDREGQVLKAWNWLHVQAKYVSSPDKAYVYDLLELQAYEDGSIRNSPSYNSDGEIPEPGTPEFVALEGVLGALSDAYDQAESQPTKA